MFLEKL